MSPKSVPVKDTHSVWTATFYCVGVRDIFYNSFDFPMPLNKIHLKNWSLRKAFLSLLAILWNSVFKWVYLSFSSLLFASFLFSAICKASSDNHFAFLPLYFLGMVLIPASCTMSSTSTHSSSGTLSVRSYPLDLFVPSTL